MNRESAALKLKDQLQMLEEQKKRLISDYIQEYSEYKVGDKIFYGGKPGIISEVKVSNFERCGFSYKFRPITKVGKGDVSRSEHIVYHVSKLERR